MIDSSRRRRFLLLLFPALVAPLQLLLFGPHTIYSGNQQEFSAPFWALAVQLLPALLASVAVLVALGLLTPLAAAGSKDPAYNAKDPDHDTYLGAWLFRRYVVALVTAGLVLWIQGNLLVADYGLLNGEGIDWSAHAWRNRYELALWIALPALAAIAARPLFSTAILASRLLVALQAVLVVSGVPNASAAFGWGGEPAARAEWQGTPASVFELSSRQNVFHFVLDGFQSDVFHEIVDADRAAIDRRFSGFVFFANHAGAFPTTIVSVPAMLTGAVYRNEEPLPEYFPKQFARGSIYSALRALGYQVDVVSGLPYDSSSATTYYRLPRPYVRYEEYRRFAAWQLADLALFRHTPHLVKPAIHNDEAWRLQGLFGRSADTLARRHLPVTGQAFLEDFTRQMRVAHDRPVYKFLHVGIPHWPVAVDADCAFVGVKPTRREGYLGQARCAVARIAAFLDRLRELGLYDDSVIVISSDHGVALAPRAFTGERVVAGAPLSDLSGAASALLLVKPARGAGPLRISSAPTTISDVPATLMDLLGRPNSFPGTPALKLAEDVDRVRSFAMYRWRSEDWRQSYFAYLDIFAIHGRVQDGDAWVLDDTIYAPGPVPAAERARGLGGTERSSSGQAFRWSGPRVFLNPPPEARGFELTVRSVAPTPQTVSVQIDNTLADRVTLNDQSWKTLRYALEPRRAQGSQGQPSKPVWVELHIDPSFRPRGERRLLGVQTRNLRWTAATPR